MKKRRFGLSFLGVLIILMSMFLSFGGAAFADETDSVKSARYGCFELIGTYNLGNGSYLKWVGTAFLIGEDDTSTTLLTCAHCVGLDSSTVSYYNLTDYSDSNVSLQIVVKSDVTLNCTLVNKSEQGDFAILQVEQSVGGRKALPLATASSLNDCSTKAVYSLGFPYYVTLMDDYQRYTPEQVTVTTGSVSKQAEISGVKYIQHDANIEGGNSGGPLIDQYGVVVGINAGSGALASTEKYCYAVDISEVTDVLDALNIKYKSADAWTGNVVTTDDTNSGGFNWIWIVVGVAVVAVIAVVVVLIVKGGKNKGQKAGKQTKQNKTNNQYAQYNPSAFDTAPQTIPQGPGADSTNTLGGDSAFTTVLQQPALAYLDRRSTGESVQITTAEFKMGREKKRVDYCIADNSSVGRLHATILFKNSKFYIKDNNSTNGTFVNDGRIGAGQEVELQNHDKIKLADEEFAFRG